MSNVQDRVQLAADNAERLRKAGKRGLTPVYGGQTSTYGEDSQNRDAFKAAVQARLPAGFEVRTSDQAGGCRNDAYFLAVHVLFL